MMLNVLWNTTKIRLCRGGIIMSLIVVSGLLTSCQQPVLVPQEVSKPPQEPGGGDREVPAGVSNDSLRVNSVKKVVQETP